VTKKDKRPSAENIKQEITEFREQQKTLILATLSETSSAMNEPLASYAPFVEDEDGHFYLLLSALAAHSSNLRQHQNKSGKFSILLIEDESASRNLFARKRLTYECRVTIWPREHPQWQMIIDKLQAAFGKTIEVLAALEDFSLYCLTPEKGNYVRGFGQAYEIQTDQLPKLRTQ
jgi:heme iron utilization protein